MTEQLVNFGITTLASTINNSVTALTVSSATGFPASGTFRIVVESEIMIVTAVSGSIFTVTRGAEGTTAVSHVSGSKVVQSLTRDGMLNYIGNYSGYGLSSARPTAGIRGRVYRPSDAPVEYWDDGTRWITISRDMVMPYGPLNIANWAAHNQGTSVFSGIGDIFFISCPGNGGDNWRYLMKTAPTAPYTITAVLHMPGAAQLQYTLASLGLRNNTTGGLKNFDILIDNSGPRISIEYYSNDTAFYNNYYRQTHNMLGPLFFKIQDNSTNLIYSVSFDGGANYVTILSHTRAELFTNVDQVILGMDNTYSGSSTFQSFYVLSYSETQP